MLKAKQKLMLTPDDEVVPAGHERAQFKLCDAGGHVTDADAARYGITAERLGEFGLEHVGPDPAPFGTTVVMGPKEKSLLPGGTVATNEEIAAAVGATETRVDATGYEGTHATQEAAAGNQAVKTRTSAVLSPQPEGDKGSQPAPADPKAKVNTTPAKPAPPKPSATGTGTAAASGAKSTSTPPASGTGGSAVTTTAPSTLVTGEGGAPSSSTGSAPVTSSPSEPNKQS